MRSLIRSASLALALLSVFLALPAFAQDATTAPGFLAQALQAAGSPLVDLVCTGLLALFAVVGRLAHNANQTNLLARAASIATDYIGGAVKHLLEGLAPDIKADLANDGVIDATERQHLLEKALLLVQAELPAWVQAVLKSGFGAGLMTMLKGKVASALDAHIAAMPDAPGAPAEATTSPNAAPVPA